MTVRVRRGSVLGLVLVVGTLSGCVAAVGPGASSPLPSTSGTQTTLSIENGTTIAVMLVVNGQMIQTVPAGGYEVNRPGNRGDSRALI